MQRKTQIDRAIENLESQVAVLNLAIAKLREQQARPKPVRKPRLTDMTKVVA